MELKWTSKAMSDVARLYGFLAPINKRIAARTLQALVTAPTSLLENSRIGEKLDEFEAREVRRISLLTMKFVTKFRKI
jgi:plasmid stabilization system protein ParE